jgi:hypothetical protein
MYTLTISYNAANESPFFSTFTSALFPANPTTFIIPIDVTQYYTNATSNKSTLLPAFM